MDYLQPGKDHSCKKPNCAYCCRLKGEATKNIVDILNLRGVKLITDKREEILEKIYLRKI
jgi:hypothetical protein